MKVSIIGQGYVGLPLAHSLVSAGFDVTGVDIDDSKVAQLNKGMTVIEDVTDDQVLSMLKTSRYIASSKYSQIAESDVVVICVPTPLSESQEPDLSALTSAVRAVAQVAKSGALVINESTSFPGTVRNLIINVFREIRPSESFDFACAPERVDPGNSVWDHKNTPRLIGGLTVRALSRAVDFYSTVCDQVVPVSSPEVAEFAKLLENSFRQINISLVTELAHISSSSGVNIYEVIEAAATKPYGFMKFVPSVGVGGHCIPVDPMYLSWFAKQKGSKMELIEIAQKINNQRPKNVAQRAVDLAGKMPARILIVGMGYKPNTSDLRQSPSVEIYRILKNAGHNVRWFDSFVDYFDGNESETNFTDFDLIIYAQPDKNFNVENFARLKTKILDCTGRLSEAAHIFQI
jgi:UDP-N-acetyl-D-glucosamine dehydrogenase